MAGLYIRNVKLPESAFNPLYLSVRRDGTVAYDGGPYGWQTTTATPVSDSPDVEDGVALHNIKEAHINLCDSCEHHYPECPAGRDDALFGSYDNVCACAKYRCRREEE